MTTSLTGTADAAGAGRFPPYVPSLLWALRSPCSRGCDYCYFGTIEEHRTNPVSEIGQLSHLSRHDVDAAQVMAFARTLPGSRIRRVFLAGGEPLIWPPFLDLVRILKEGGLQVIICTEGTQLNRPDNSDTIVDLGVDAVSVSLDSVDAAYNDRLRPARNGKDGWNEVVSGISALIAARGDRLFPKVGIYSVITNENLPDLEAVPALAETLGCDYFVPQPLSLDPDHALFGMSLTGLHVPELLRRFAALDGALARVHVPSEPYPQQFATAITAPSSTVQGCFGGRDLFFVQPDGSLWDCPSQGKISSTPPGRRRSIRGADAADLFGPASGCGDCALFSRDCVNMWPLMGFGAIIGSPA